MEDAASGWTERRVERMEGGGEEDVDEEEESVGEKRAYCDERQASKVGTLVERSVSGKG